MHACTVKGRVTALFERSMQYNNIMLHLLHVCIRNCFDATNDREQASYEEQAFRFFIGSSYLGYRPFLNYTDYNQKE